MAREMFRDVTDPSIHVGNRQWHTLPVSILAHILVIALLIVVPLMAGDVLPTPRSLTAQIVFKHVPRGFAAVTVLHDENMNRKIDKNFIGIPKEGYGTSNNPKKARHEPRWDEARFPVSRPEETITIKMIYW